MSTTDRKRKREKEGEGGGEREREERGCKLGLSGGGRWKDTDWSMSSILYAQNALMHNLYRNAEIVSLHMGWKDRSRWQ